MKKNSKLNIFFRIITFILFLFIFFIILLSNSKYIEKIDNKYFKNIINNNFFSKKKYKKKEKKIQYFVQLGIFAKHYEVDKIRVEMIMLGFQPNVENYFISGKLSKKVTLGPYFSKKSVNKVLKKLERNNIKYYVINE